MRRLIVNADDFGMTDRVTAGIVEAINNGIVTSTTAMMCVEGSLERVNQWHHHVPGRVGLHLQLTDGKPCCDPETIPTLVGENGRFPRKLRKPHLLDVDEVRREWMAQMERFQSLGIEPTHIDTHHNVHKKHPKILDVYSAIAQQYRTRARSGNDWLAQKLRHDGVACPDYTTSRWYGRPVTADQFIKLAKKAFQKIGSKGTIELGCHPGFVDESLGQISSYVEEREIELRILCDPEISERLSSLDIHVVPMTDLLTPL